MEEVGDSPASSMLPALTGSNGRRSCDSYSIEGRWDDRCSHYYFTSKVKNGYRRNQFNDVTYLRKLTGS